MDFLNFSQAYVNLTKTSNLEKSILFWKKQN